MKQSMSHYSCPQGLALLLATVGSDIMFRKGYSMDLPQGIYECQPVGGIAHSSLPLLQLQCRGTKMVEGEDEREGEREEGRRGREEKK